MNGPMNQSPEQILINGGAARMVLRRMDRLFVTIREEYVMYMVDRFFLPIVKAFDKLHKEYDTMQFKQVYTQVCLNLGAAPDRATLGFAPCPYSGLEKNMKGLIRSWVEERSPHSRQRYFRGGRRVTWGQNERPLLFVNPVLGEMNTNNGWRPYTHARGRGWAFNPEAAEASQPPTVEVLAAAEALYVKRGMQGRGRVKNTCDVQFGSIKYSVKGKGVMHAVF